MADNGAHPEEEDVKGIEAPDVVTKYKDAAIITNKALATVLKGLVAGMPVIKLAALGDKVLTDGAAAVYNKARDAAGAKLTKGIAFPTCISINHCAAHFCPIATDEFAGVTLAAGDLVSIQLGAHIDGYVALAATCAAVRPAADAETPTVTGKAADALVAAQTAAEAALRVLRPGRTNADVTEVVKKAAAAYGCTPLEGVLSHQVTRNVLDGEKVILNKATIDHKVDLVTFEKNEVWVLDVAISTGEGKTRETVAKPTVFKRQAGVEYMLKMKASRAVFSEITSHFPVFPFSVRALSNETRGKLGMTELAAHGLVTPYPVLYEKEGAFVARVQVTALILPTQTMPITTMDAPAATSEVMLEDEELKALLATPLGKPKKKKGKGGAAASAAAAAAATPAAAPVADDGAMETTGPSA